MAKFPALPLSVEEESKNRAPTNFSIRKSGCPFLFSQLEKVGVLFSSKKRVSISTRHTAQVQSDLTGLCNQSGLLY